MGDGAETKSKRMNVAEGQLDLKDIGKVREYTQMDQGCFSAPCSAVLAVDGTRRRDLDKGSPRWRSCFVIRPRRPHDPWRRALFLHRHRWSSQRARPDRDLVHRDELPSAYDGSFQLQPSATPSASLVAAIARAHFRSGGRVRERRGRLKGSRASTTRDSTRLLVRIRLERVLGGGDVNLGWRAEERREDLDGSGR